MTTQAGAAMLKAASDCILFLASPHMCKKVRSHQAKSHIVEYARVAFYQQGTSREASAYSDQHIGTDVCSTPTSRKAAEACVFTAMH